MNHEDKIAFGRAYKQSLDIVKHGGFAKLPFHLHDRIPNNLMRFINVSEDEYSIAIALTSTTCKIKGIPYFYNHNTCSNQTSTRNANSSSSTCAPTASINQSIMATSHNQLSFAPDCSPHELSSLCCSTFFWVAPQYLHCWLIMHLTMISSKWKVGNGLSSFYALLWRQLITGHHIVLKKSKSP